MWPRFATGIHLFESIRRENHGGHVENLRVKYVLFFKKEGGDSLHFRVKYVLLGGGFLI